LLAALLALLIVGGHIHNCCNFDARPEGYEYGLYASEKVNGEKIRWTSRWSCVRVRAETDLMGIKIFAAPHNIGEEGLFLELSVNDVLLDCVHFSESGLKPLYYYVPSFKGKEITLKTKVSETFNPYRLGLSRDIRKNREQGVAVSPVTFLRIMPLDGVGLRETHCF
jgi:hypothetical protein